MFAPSFVLGRGRRGAGEGEGALSIALIQLESVGGDVFLKRTGLIPLGMAYRDSIRQTDWPTGMGSGQLRFGASGTSTAAVFFVGVGVDKADCTMPAGSGWSCFGAGGARTAAVFFLIGVGVGGDCGIGDAQLGRCGGVDRWYCTDGGGVTILVLAATRLS